MNQIHLTLPRTWNALTAQQLEAVSRVFIDEARSYTLTGEYNRTRLMVRCFFAVSGLRVTSLALSDEVPEGATSPIEGPTIATSATPPEHTYYTCEYIDLTQRNQLQTVDGRVVPVRIYLNEIKSLTVGDIEEQDIRHYLKRLERYHARLKAGKVADEPNLPEPKGPLSWLMKPCTMTFFPYPELTLPDSAGGYERWLNPKTCKVEVRERPKTVTLAGPAEFLQDFSWQQYRFSCDLMSYLMQCENALYKEQQKNALSPRLQQLTQMVQDARAQWLANLFSRPVLYEDPDTRQLVYAPKYLPSQCNDNAYLFRDFPEEKFQAISFFWQGMMQHLSREFPKVFKSNEVNTLAGEHSDPFQLYTRSTTTMIKYAATNEDQVNHTTYTIILQHMQDMAEENERIEKMKSK